MNECELRLILNAATKHGEIQLKNPLSLDVEFRQSNNESFTITSQSLEIKEILLDGLCSSNDRGVASNTLFAITCEGYFTKYRSIQVQKLFSSVVVAFFEYETFSGYHTNRCFLPEGDPSLNYLLRH